MTIKAYLVGQDRLLARMEKMYPNAQQSLLKAITRLAAQLQRRVMQDKLSGQVLHARTGTLRRSINYRTEQTDTSTSGQVGTNTVYAAIHEYGGTILMKPRERVTYFKIGKNGTVGNRFVKKSKSNFSMTHAARSMGTYITMPERSFLRSALRDIESQIKEDMEKAVKQAMKK